MRLAPLSISVLACIAVIFLAEPLRAAEPVPKVDDERQPAATKTESQPGRQLLRWKFAKGDVLRFAHQAVENIVIDYKSTFRNERTYVVRWTVREVDEDGTATVSVSFERVQFKLQVPELMFDSATDKAGREPADTTAREQYYAARALAQSEFTCSSTNRGGTGSIAGGEAVQLTTAPIMFTPGDWPALPEQAVKQGDSWTAPADVVDPMGSMSGETTHVLRGANTIDGRSALEIDCTTEYTKLSGPMYEGAKVSPASVVAHFDPATGRFLSRRVKLSVDGRTGGNERYTLNVEATFRLLPTSPPSAWKPRNPAEGIRFGEGQELLIIAHSDWIDENKNAIPEAGEFRGVKTQFSEDEKYCLALFVSGLKGKKLHYDLVNARGKKLTSNDIPLKGDDVAAFRQIVDDTGTRSGLIAGMYFLQWYLDDRYFHFTPLHIVGGKQTDAAALENQLAKPATAEEFVARGYARFKQGNYDAAIDDYDAAIRLDGRHWRAHLLRGLAHFNNKDLAAAEADLSASIRLNASNPGAFSMRALCRVRQGRLDDAIKDATESIRLDPKVPDSHSVRGEAWARKGEIDKAIADYDQALKFAPEDASAYRERGRLWGLKSQLDKCIADEGDALRLNPTDGAAYMHRGTAWLMKKEWDQAIADFDRAIHYSDPNLRLHLSRAEAWRNKGDLEKAIADYDATIRLDPSSIVAYHLRGDLRAALRDFDRSIADHSEVLRMNPKDVDAWVQRGIAYVSKRELDKGVSDLTEALRLKPDHYVAFCIRGDAWISKGQYQKSIDDHTAAIAANPKLASAYHHRGATFSSVGKYAEAIKDFEEAIRLDPKVPWPHFAYSLILSASPEEKFRDGKRAVAMAKTAGDLLEWKRPEVWMALAAAHAESGDFDAAIQAQTKALQLKPEDDHLQAQLDLYRQKKPFRETPRPDKPAPRRVRF